MNEQNDKTAIESVKVKMKSVTKQKICLQREIMKLRSLDTSLCDEVVNLKAEYEFLVEQLHDLSSQIAEAHHQIALIEICASSEGKKIEAQVASLRTHENGFEQLFEKERNFYELRNKAMKEKDEVINNMEKEKEHKVTEKIEKILKDATETENECETIEQYNAVLKKRNNAMMLKLRKKLVEAEDIRRKLLINKTNDTPVNSVSFGK